MVDQPLGAADLSAEEFSRNVAHAPDAALDEMMRGPQRRQILDGVFRGMIESADPDRLEGVDGVIHWHIGGRADGGEDVYEIVFRTGAVSVRSDPQETPRVTASVGGADFLKIASGNETRPELFVAGKLKLEGDVAFAVRMGGIFKPPYRVKALAGTVLAGRPPEPGSSPAA
ncbi:MAG: SCP2 sterol-binding domain-containing protein [Acidimicrobiia bacterium]